jgi:dTDP-4-amino-4,6-dideoxygalactose transaminase
LEGHPNIKIPLVLDNVQHVWHLFVIQVVNRNIVQEKLRELGIETMIHYPIPPHLSGAYKENGWEKGSFPVTEILADTILSLPMGPHLPISAVGTICEKLIDISKV